jgi:hypothetical protein
MNLKPVVLGLLAAACVTAAAGGAYLAVRQNAAAGTVTVTAPRSTAPTAPAAQPVTETEALVTPSAGAAKPAPAEAPDPAAPSSRASKADAVHQAPTPARTPARPAEKVVARQESPAKPNGAAKGSDPAAQAQGSTQAMRDANPPSTSASGDVPLPEPARPAEAPAAPPEPKFVEVVIPASAVIGLQVDRSLSSETAHVEDRIEARVTRDVMAGGQRAIPAGSRMIGSVVVVDRGGKIKDPARLGVRFHTLVLADGTEMPLRTEAIYRDGESPGNESSRKIGGAAVGGAILGAIIGGGKGAMIGGATGAGAGTAAVMAGGRNAATLPAGTIVTARVAGPVTIQVEKEE